MDASDTNIFIAASDGDIALVQRFLAQGERVTAQDELGYSVLHAAASYNHLSLMSFLLAQVAAVDAIVDCDGDTALHVAETREMAALLVGHCPSLAEIRNSEGLRAIEVADSEGHSDMVRFLGEYCPDYVPLADRTSTDDSLDAVNQDELEYLLNVADLHEMGPDGEPLLSINMGKLHEMIEAGKLNSILAHQENMESTTNTLDGNGIMTTGNEKNGNNDDDIADR